MVGELVVLWGVRESCGIGETVGNPGWTDLPPHLHPQRRGRGPTTVTHQACAKASHLTQLAIASPFAPRAPLPWCGLITVFMQGPGIKTAHLKVVNLASFQGCICSGEVPCLGFTLRDLVNLYFFALQLRRIIQTSHLYS